MKLIYRFCWWRLPAEWEKQPVGMKIEPPHIAGGEAALDDRYKCDNVFSQTTPVDAYPAGQSMVLRYSQPMFGVDGFCVQGYKVSWVTLHSKVYF